VLTKTGQPCTVSFECGWLSTCFTNPSDGSKKCTEYGSLAVGTLIGNSDMANFYYLCSTFYAYVEGKDADTKTYCMPAP